MKNKAFLLIIVVIFGLLLCTSCSKNREYDETEVITAANDLIMRTKLSSVSDDDGIQEYSRYYQKYNALDNSEECIMVRKDALVNLTDTVIYDYSSLHVSRVKKDEVFVKISATVITDDGKTQVQEIEISLLEEESGWRINSPTYVRYFDRQQYEDLQKNK